MTETQEFESTMSTGAKDSASGQGEGVAAAAKGEAVDVVETAKEQVQAVTSDVREQTRQLAGEARGQLTDHAFAQRDNAVESLRSVGDELTAMAERADSPGLGAQLTREAGAVAHRTADFLQEREPAQLVEELRGLARRRPGAFLLGAGVAGLLVGRVTRGAKSAHSSDSESASGSAQTNVGYAVPVVEPVGGPDVWGPESPVYPASVPDATDPGVMR